jgi:hypothetical protein
VRPDDLDARRARIKDSRNSDPSTETATCQTKQHPRIVKFRAQLFFVWAMLDSNFHRGLRCDFQEKQAILGETSSGQAPLQTRTSILVRQRTKPDDVDDALTS